MRGRFTRSALSNEDQGEVRGHVNEWAKTCYETLTTRISLLKLRNLSSNSLKTSPISQNSPNLSLILIHATNVVHLLECRAGNTATHVRGSGGRHQRRITQVVDFLLPLLHRL